MLTIFNKVSRIWNTVEDEVGPTLDSDWIINPAFEDEARAWEYGQAFWTYDGNIIKVPSAEVYAILIHDQEQDIMWDNIKAERDRRKNDGGYRVGNYWYHSDSTSRIQQIALVMMGGNIPPGLQWKTMSGDFVTMTQGLAMQVFMAAVTSDSVLFGIAEQKHATMLTLSEPKNFDYLSGWPRAFGE